MRILNSGNAYNRFPASPKLNINESIKKPSTFRRLNVINNDNFSPVKAKQKKKRQGYFLNMGSFTTCCYFLILIMSLFVWVNSFDEFQRVADVDFFNIMSKLPNFVRTGFILVRNINLPLLITSLVLQITGMYYSKGRTTFSEILSLLFQVPIIYLYLEFSLSPEICFLRTATTGVLMIFVSANLFLPKLPKHRTKPNTIMSAFHTESPLSQCNDSQNHSYASSIANSSRLNQTSEDMEVCEVPLPFLKKHQYRELERDETPIREIRPRLDDINFGLGKKLNGITNVKNPFGTINWDRPVGNSLLQPKPLFEKSNTKENIFSFKNDLLHESVKAQDSVSLVQPQNTWTINKYVLCVIFLFSFIILLSNFFFIYQLLYKN